MPECGKLQPPAANRQKFGLRQNCHSSVPNSLFHLQNFRNRVVSNRLAVSWDLPFHLMDVELECSLSASFGSFQSKERLAPLLMFRLKQPPSRGRQTAKRSPGPLVCPTRKIYSQPI